MTQDDDVHEYAEVNVMHFIFQMKLVISAASVPEKLFSAGQINIRDAEANRALMDDLGISAVCFISIINMFACLSILVSQTCSEYYLTLISY